MALLYGGSAWAQEMEPRAYSNAPIGMNFLLMGYGYSNGALLFDPSLPVQGANAAVNIGLAAYAHAFEFKGQSAKFAMVLPYAGLDANGVIDSVYHERVVSGLADPAIAVSVNISGAPALTFNEFLNYQQDTIVGATIKLSVPWGQYDPDRLLNLGSNRWSLKPELGISQALGKWIVEGAAAVTFYSDNNDFFGGQELEQAPIYSMQGHVVYNFSPGLWTAINMTYFTGGISKVDGIEKDNKLNNWRLGITLALPMNKFSSIKLAVSTGISTRTGTDFDAILLAWQYRWGGGL
ncbi:MAG: transporter [Gammaproteobacteria bacterium]